MTCSTGTVGREPSGTVRGRVLAADTGLFVPGATVVVVDGAGLAPDIAPVTGEAGEFELRALTPGAWVFKAISPRGEIGEGSVEVIAGRTVEMTIMVEPYDSGEVEHTE